MTTAEMSALGFTALESGNNVEAQTRGQTPGKKRDESIQIFLIELRQPEPGMSDSDQLQNDA